MVWRVRAQWTGAPVIGPAVSTFFFNTAAGTPQDASDQVATFLTALDANLATTLGWATENTVDELDTATGTLLGSTSVTTASGSGGNAGEPLPRSTQGLAQWTTATIVSGRALRGRMFIPGFCENNNDSGVPGSATISGVNTILSNFVSDSPAIFVAWSRTHGVQGQVTGGTMWNQWAVLRSRRQ